MLIDISLRNFITAKELLPPQTCSKNDDCFAQFAPHRRTFKQNKYSDTAIIQLIGTNDLGECENRGDTSKKKKKRREKTNGLRAGVNGLNRTGLSRIVFCY